MTAYRIQTPVPGATTDIGPVHFHNGVAECDDEQPNVPAVLDYCRQSGYVVTGLDREAHPLVPEPVSLPPEVAAQYAGNSVYL